MSDKLDAEALDNFKKYLRIKSVHPNCDYASCVEFLEEMSSRIGLTVQVHYLTETGNPIVILSWKGSEPNLPSVLLSSHMDVVPVYPESWICDPFAAEEDENGTIFARGAQDCKCLGIQYLEAVHRLKITGFKPKRTIHVCFTSDEEIGSLGMKYFSQTDAFRSLNVGCVMDEGCANADESFIILNGEKTAYTVKITCAGSPGHGSSSRPNTAGEKLTFVLNKFYEKRASELKKLATNNDLSSGDITVLNLTVVNGGVQSNVIPPEMTAIFDCRVSLEDDHDEFENWVRQVCKQAGDGVSVEFVDKKKRVEPTRLTEDNAWWMALKKQFQILKMKVVPQMCPAATDARYLRSLGIPCFNFSPMNNTKIKIHEHNEFLNKHVFFNGIKVFCDLIPALSNV